MCGRVGPGASAAAARFALPHLHEGRAAHVDSRPGPWPHPRWPPPRHTQLPGSGLGQPAPLAGLAGQLASATLGAEGGGSCPAGRPGAQGPLGLLLHLRGPHCVFLTGPRGPSWLGLPVYTPVCLNLELSLSLGLTVSQLWACLDLPFRPSVCLLGVCGPLPVWPRTHSAGWARPQGHVHILLRLWTGVRDAPAQLLPARLPDPADEPAGNR